ncbi:MAG: hypothetical protein ACK5CW_16690 [Verrucomicrobiota bacterium]
MIFRSLLRITTALLAAISLTSCIDPATVNALAGASATPGYGPGYPPPPPPNSGNRPGYYDNNYHQHGSGYYNNNRPGYPNQGQGYYNQGPGYYETAPGRPGAWNNDQAKVYDMAYRLGQDDFYRGKDKHMTNHKKMYDSSTHDSFKRGYESGYDAARRKAQR